MLHSILILVIPPLSTGTGVPGTAESALLHARVSHRQGCLGGSCILELHTTDLRRGRERNQNQCVG